MTYGWVPQPRPDLRRLRAGHADRERAIDVLKAAFAEGRLDQDEYTERVGQVHASRTYGELEALTADLPVGPLGSLAQAGLPAPVAAPLLPMPQYLDTQQLDARYLDAQYWQAQQLEIQPERPVAEADRRDSGVSGIALVSLVCGVLAVAVSWAFLMAVPAMLGGWIALAGPGRRGRWMAWVAIALGVLAIKRSV